jgi:uncharacterized repeat protein (TIGR03803 family)
MSSIRIRPVLATLAPAMLFVLICSPLGRAQTFSVLHNFTGGSDGSNPQVGLTIDAGGRLYGTAGTGGAGFGTVFQMKRAGSGWIFTSLHSFTGGNDGAAPLGRVIFGPNGTLYGNTHSGGGGRCDGGCGTVFNLQPQPRVCNHTLCPWMERVLYAFQGGFLDDGLGAIGNVAFDQAGNLYGATSGGGVQFDGTVYELIPSMGGWTENVLYSFAGGQNDGAGPLTGPTFGYGGNLYGTTANGGPYNRGVVYELTPSGSGWTENVIHSFVPATDGGYPQGVIADSAGNLYGGTSLGGQYGGGTIFQLTPSNGSWTFTVVYQLTEGGCGVVGPLVMDAANNLYGAACDNVFKLSPSGGAWTYTQLYHFTDGSDGGNPNGNMVLDATGNLYGTTANGGTGNCFRGCGVVFEITP